MKILILMLIVISCSRINQQEHDQYTEDLKMRHGVIPLPTPQKTTPANFSEKMREDSVARGKALYVAHCIECHGSMGQGDGEKATDLKRKPADLKKLAQQVAHFKFYMSISQWENKMPGWKEHFDESQREDLVAYIKTFR
ncbi:MAG: cytochrome c [Bacteriovoracaceae bacterium]|nr:cytochrome c [Bacteriovoracaceae bacterium]